MFHQHYMVSFDEIVSQQNNLVMLSHLDEWIIQAIWISQGDTALTQFDKIKYNFSLPIFAKMIIRFQQTRSATYFWCELDPNNRHRLLNRYGIKEDIGDKIMYFFVWIKNHKRKAAHSDEISYYFALSSEKQKSLVKDYTVSLKSLMS